MDTKTIPADTAAATGAGSLAEWRKAMADRDAAKAAYDEFLAEWSPKHDAMQVEVDKVPHVTLRPDPYTGKEDAVTTADTLFINRARATLRDVDAGKVRFDSFADLQSHLQLCRDVVAADDGRQAQIKAIQDRFAKNDACNKLDELCDALCDCELKLMEFPSPDLSALRWKLDRLREDDGEIVPWSADYVAQTFADIDRLLPKAA